MGRIRSASRLVDDGMFRKKAGKRLATAASAGNPGSRHPKLRLRDRHPSTHTFLQTCPHVFVWFCPSGLHEQERRHLVRATRCSLSTAEPAVVASVYFFLTFCLHVSHPPHFHVLAMRTSPARAAWPWHRTSRPSDSIRAHTGVAYGPRSSYRTRSGTALLSSLPAPSRCPGEATVGSTCPSAPDLP